MDATAGVEPATLPGMNRSPVPPDRRDPTTVSATPDLAGKDEALLRHASPYDGDLASAGEFGAVRAQVLDHERVILRLRQT